MSHGFTQPLTLTLGHLYPDQLNLYGDRGNILTLRRRCQLRGIELRIVGLGIGDALAPDEYDILFIGGGQDKEQAPVAQDLHEMKESACGQRSKTICQCLPFVAVPTLSPLLSSSRRTRHAGSRRL